MRKRVEDSESQERNTTLRSLGRHLGTPLIRGRMTKAKYQPTVDKAQSKISGSKEVSLARLATLAENSLLLLPVFA